MYSSCIHFGVPKFGKPPQWLWQQCVIESQPPSPARGSPSVLQVITRDILETVRCTMTAGSAISHCNIDNIQENWGLSTQLISCSASKVCEFGLQSKPLHFFKILVAYLLQLNHSNICSPLTYQRFPEVCCIFVAMLSNCEPCSAWTRSACSFRSVWSSSRSEPLRKVDGRVCAAVWASKFGKLSQLRTAVAGWNMTGETWTIMPESQQIDTVQWEKAIDDTGNLKKKYVFAIDLRVNNPGLHRCNFA